jgi:hypothetical protein
MKKLAEVTSDFFTSTSVAFNFLNLEIINFLTMVSYGKMIFSAKVVMFITMFYLNMFALDWDEI